MSGENREDFKDDANCEHEYKNLPGYGKVCILCGESPEGNSKEKEKSSKIKNKKDD